MSTPKKLLLVWDLPIRVFHWLLVIGIGVSWFTVEILENLELHFYAGYFILTLLSFRILWGVWGSYHAKFQQFIRAPKAVARYLATLLDKNSQVYLGHNPLGGYAVVLLLSCLLFQATSGMFSSDDYFYGPLAGCASSHWIERFSSWHQSSFDVLCALMLMHIMAVLFYQLYKRQPLIKSMLDGRKTAPQSEQLAHQSNQTMDQTAGHATNQKTIFLRAFVFLLLSALVVYYLANFACPTVQLNDQQLYF